MPYRWDNNALGGGPRLRLWPHRSLPLKGFAAVILIGFVLFMIPLLPLLGTVALWALLPFLLLGVAALWLALRRSYRDGRVCEALVREGDTLILTHQPVKGPTKRWSCNIYWARVDLHLFDGPVPNYVTLSGNGRDVEIGRFLSEDERKALYEELRDFLKRAA